MRKRRQGLNLYVALLATALLASCSRDDSAWGASGNEADRRPLAVASLLAPVSLAHTRVTTTPLPTDGSVGFFVLANDHYSAVVNKKGVYKADEKLWLPTDSIWLARATANLALYYPYDAAQATAGTLNLKAAVRTDESKDLWSARFEADSHTKDISLTLTQLYSRLSITFVTMADAPYTGTAALNALKLEGAGVYATAAYSLSDAKYTYTTEGYTTSITGVTIKGTNAAADDATKVDLLLPPYEILTKDLTLTATVDTKEMKIVIPKAKLSNTLAAGKQYNITLKLKPTALVLDANSIKITEWDSQTAFNEEAKMEDGPIEYVDLGLDFVIAPGNLVATSDGKGGYTYKFAEDQGYYSGTSAGGDYFRWNTLDPTATVSTSPTHVWDVNNDPCRKVEGGWRTPTEEDLSALEQGAPNPKPDVKLRVSGTYRTRGGKEVNGYYFGTSTVPINKADQDKYVFLPAAGWYSKDNVWQDWAAGSWGMYWSATPVDSDWVSRLVLGEYGTDVGSSLWETAYYNCGISLRCVRDK